jgi:hypothetical protein
VSTEKRVTFNDRDEPVVVITITGWHDAFRFAWALGHLQVEFADLGRRIGGSLRRRLGAAEFRRLHRTFTSGSLAWVRDEPEEPSPVERAMADIEASAYDDQEMRRG